MFEKHGHILNPNKTYNYFIYLVGARGFEPPTTWPPAKYATRLRYAPKIRIITEQKYPRIKVLAKYT